MKRNDKRLTFYSEEWKTKGEMKVFQFMRTYITSKSDFQIQKSRHKKQP